MWCHRVVDKTALKAACIQAASYLYSSSFESPAKEISAFARELYREVTSEHWDAGEHDEMHFAGLARAKAAMKVDWPAVMAAVVMSFFTHQLSVRLGNGTLTASVGGTPVHLTANAILAAAYLAFEGAPASIQSGAVLVTFTPSTY